MIQFVRTRNLELVQRLITAPGSWEFATDDTAPPAADWRALADDRIHYVLGLDGDGIIGLFTLIQQNSVCFEIHVTRAYGARAQAAGFLIVPWIFENVPGCKRIVASIACTNRAAIRYAERCRFSRYGVNRKSFLRGGKLIDQVLLGVSPEDLGTKEVI